MYLIRSHLRILSAALAVLVIFSFTTIYWIISPGVITHIEHSLSIPQVSQNYFAKRESRKESTVKLQAIVQMQMQVEDNFISDNNNKVPLRYGSAVLYDEREPQSQSTTTDKKRKNQRFDEVEKDVDRRIKRVDELCRKYHLGKYNWKNNNSNSLSLKEPPTPLYSYFFWNRERRLGWCPVYKSGSTSFLYNMMILAGFSEKELETPSKQLSVLAREVYGDAEPDQDVIRSSLKVLVVRHPFQRLLSAYRDKLENSSAGLEHGTHHFNFKYGRKIVKKFRKEEDFNGQIEPSWVEFVRYLLSTDLLQYSDDHWLPAYYSCTPCLVDYDIIAQTESYNRDQEYIIYRAGLEGIIRPRWSHKISEDKNKWSLTTLYFSQLTKTQIEQLYKKYWFDFELFGYDYLDYLKLGSL